MSPTEPPQESCRVILLSDTFSPTDSKNYTSSYTQNKLNQSDSGTYFCMTETIACSNTSVQSVYLRVYKKPNYGTHIAIISTTAILLLIILVGLFSFVRRIQDRYLNRYQELLSSTNVQYHPTKVK